MPESLAAETVQVVTGIRRLRRLRDSARMRALTAETHLHRDQLIQPHFVVERAGDAGAIATLPGIARVTIDQLVRECVADAALGIGAVLLFGIPAAKDTTGEIAADPDGIVPQAVRALKAEFGSDLLVITDVCQCQYLSHGHCGFPDETGHIQNDATLVNLGRIALSHAEAGADLLAPSDMMDFRIASLRATLDAAGFGELPVMSYAVKFASAYYGPFREAAGSAPQFGDRRSYQLDPRNRRQALLEAALDAGEGADILMVKPALAYLDCIRDLRDRTDLPVACFNVSGEYAMVHLAAQAGIGEAIALALENLIAMRRAGADLLITYHARELLRAGAL